MVDQVDGLLMDALDEVESDVLLSGMTKCSRRWLPEKSQCESRRGVVLSECHYGADCRQRFPFVAQSEAARSAGPPRPRRHGLGKGMIPDLCSDMACSQKFLTEEIHT